MPKLSDTMEEGAVATWLKKEGEAIKEGEALVEIETDKATQEYESPEAGILLKILVPAGKSVALRTPIAVIGEKGEAIPEIKTAGGQVLAKTAAPAAPAVPAAPVALVAQGSPVVTASKHEASPIGGRVKSSPLARKVAAERGIDVAALAGSGPGGRIVLRDVEQAKDAQAVTRSAPAQVGLITASGTSVPVSMMRKTIAKRLLAAKNDAPHFYLTVSANVGKLEDWRQQLNEAAAKAAKSGAVPSKVSLNDGVILAVSRALRRHPMVNASWQGETILLHHQVHVAVAVALPEGLVTPVIRNSDQLGVREIAAQSRELAAKAKAGGLSNDAYQGGTFTISNLGMFGIEEFTAIINPPQAAILAVGAAMATPWVDDHQRVVVQQHMRMTLSCDHRVVDGASGAQFLQTLVAYLENPLAILAG
jgi:pyruvate dehydrogenase E2 component (dihydrolipoamide acetyltransferase)